MKSKLPSPVPIALPNRCGGFGRPHPDGIEGSAVKFVSLTAVELTPDYAHAKVFYTTLDSEHLAAVAGPRPSRRLPAPGIGAAYPYPYAAAIALHS